MLLVKRAHVPYQLGQAQFILYWCRYMMGIRRFSTTLATPFLSQLTSALDTLCTNLGCQFTGRGKEEGGKSGTSLTFSRALCFPQRYPHTPGSLWSSRSCGPSQGLADTVTLTHPLVVLGLHAALGTGANPSPQCSTAPHSCCLALKPLMGTCTAQKKPFIRYSLQDVSIQCEKEAGR